MQTNRYSERERITRVAVLGRLIALSIVAGKYLAIRVGELFRFSLESTPILLAGILFGPVAGAAVGVIADLVGCVLVGYAINPLVTLGAAAIGALAGVLYARLPLRRGVRLFLTVLGAHLVGSVLIKTFGLATYYDTPFFVLLAWRALNYLVVGALDGAVVHLLLNGSAIAKYDVTATKAEEKNQSEERE